MAQLDSDLLDDPVGSTDERKAALKLVSMAIKQNDIDGLDEVLQMLGFKPSPEPLNPSKRNTFGRAM